MKKILFIIFMLSAFVLQSQIIYIPVGNNRRFIDTTSIDRLGVNVSTLKPERPLHVVADTIRFEGLDGTGSYLKKINSDGDFILSKIRKADIEDLDPYEVLIGDPSGSGNAYQDDDLFYNEDIFMMPSLFMSNTYGGLFLSSNEEFDFSPSDGQYQAYLTSNSMSIITDLTNPKYAQFDPYLISVGQTTAGASTSAMLTQGGTLILTMPSNKFTTIARAAGGIGYTIYLPNTQGAAGTFLKNDGSGNLSWDAGASGTVTSIATSSPITGGTITSTGTIGINDAVADGTTKGASSFTANDFNSSSGNISIDYTNGQSSSSSSKGFLTSTDWSTFNNKVSTTLTISTTSPLSGGGDLSSNRTLSIADAAADGATKGAASFTASDFDASSGNISIDYTNGQKASASVPGFVSTSAQDIAGVKTFQTDIAFEGTTADGFETSVTVTDPTADNTVTVQNVTGTIPMSVGTPISLTAQTAAIAASNVYLVPSDGYYAVYYNATVTTAATSSCTLGPFYVKYTEATDNVVKTFPTSSINFVNQTNRNNTDAAIGGVFTVHAKSGTQIQYVMGYTSSGATAMQYNIEVLVVKLR